MIRVWTDNRAAGMLDLPRLANGAPDSRRMGTTFVYEPGIDRDRAVSVTMPVRLASWDTTYGVAPIFDMNLPEGALRERLRMAFAKATGSFDDLDLLSIVGRSQLGRIRFTAVDAELDENVPFQSVDEIISSRRGGELYRYMIEKFAVHSGISGVQPKFLLRDADQLSGSAGEKRALPSSFRGATHIVKFWDPGEFPQLAANEFFCLKAAERCGLRVPRHRISEDGSALILERFDLRADGTYRGFEDFCVLNGRRAGGKYRGSYETAILRRFQQFARSENLLAECLELFKLISLNCAIRNGDAHLKNFAILYDEVEGDAHLAPAYDLVTTTVYLPEDRMALTMYGSNHWPTAKELIQLGEKLSLGTKARFLQLFEQIADALSETARDIEEYGREHLEFLQVGHDMIEQWQAGMRSSLKL